MSYRIFNKCYIRHFLSNYWCCCIVNTMNTMLMLDAMVGNNPCACSSRVCTGIHRVSDCTAFQCYGSHFYLRIYPVYTGLSSHNKPKSSHSTSTQAS